MPRNSRPRLRICFNPPRKTIIREAEMHSSTGLVEEAVVFPDSVEVALVEVVEIEAEAPAGEAQEVRHRIQKSPQWPTNEQIRSWSALRRTSCPVSKNW